MTFPPFSSNLLLDYERNTGGHGRLADKSENKLK